MSEPREKPQTWPPRPRAGDDPSEPLTTPFFILVDTAEQLPYQFRGIRTNPSDGGRLLNVQTVRHGLQRLGGGDYSIAGMEKIVVVERKSKADLYSSVAKRENFEVRLRGMEERPLAAVVVEAEYFDCLKNPPTHSNLNPRALSRTLIAWAQRFSRVHWFFLPGREAAEGFTYRYLERAWLDNWPGDWVDLETWSAANPDAEVETGMPAEAAAS